MCCWCKRWLHTNDLIMCHYSLCRRNRVVFDKSMEFRMFSPTIDPDPNDSSDMAAVVSSLTCRLFLCLLSVRFGLAGSCEIVRSIDGAGCRYSAARTTTCAIWPYDTDTTANKLLRVSFENLHSQEIISSRTACNGVAKILSFLLVTMLTIVELKDTRWKLSQSQSIRLHEWHLA